MKKIFTLVAATLLTVAVFAADRRPSITLKTTKNYEVVIDGRSYSGNGAMEISLMRSGQHSIKVYEQSRGRFFKMRSKKLISSSSFQVGRNDIDISIDFRGQISIKEDRFGHDKWDDHKDSRDKGYGNDKNGHGKRF